jgi:hypothetical protein
VNKPLPVALEYTFALDSMHLKNSVQAGFRRLCWMPTVKQSDKIITNFGNLVAMKKHICDAIFMNDASVSAGEVATVDDRLVHQVFDLAHGDALVN